MYRWRCLICLFTLLSAMLGQACAQPVIIDKTTKQVFLNPYAQVLLDESGQINIEDILNHPQQLTFSNDITPFGSRYDKTLWLKFNIDYKNQDGHYWIIEFQPSTIRHIDAYLVGQDNNILSSYIYRDDIPFAQQETPYRNPIFKVYIEPNAKPTLYLRVDNSNGVLRDVTMLNPYTFIENSSTSQLLWGGVFGIYIVLILVSCWFERVVKDGIYGAFAFYVATCACIDLQISGWWKQIIFPEKICLVFLCWQSRLSG